MANKESYSQFIFGGAVLAGLFLMTKNATAEASNAPGMTPGLFAWIKESTEYNDQQIIEPAISPDAPQIVIPYSLSDSTNYFMDKGMTQEAAEMQAAITTNRAYPSVVSMLENLYNSPGRTVVDRNEIYAHLTPLYNVMDIPNNQRVPAPGATVATTVPSPDPVEEFGVPDVRFRQILDDIVTIDGQRLVSYDATLQNPVLTPEANDLYLITTLHNNLITAAGSPSWTDQQKTVLNSIFTLSKNKKAELEAAQNVSGVFTEMNGLRGRQMTNRLGRRYARSMSGMKSWSKHSAQQVYEARRNEQTRDMTLKNMQRGMDINLYTPVDTLDVTSGSPRPDMNQVTNVGSGLVKTRDSMRRLL